MRLVENKWFGDRGKRLSELLASDDSVTFEELLAFATDTLVWKGRQWVPLVLEPYERFAVDISNPDKTLQEAVNVLKNWDFRSEADSPGMALFQLFYLRANLGRMNPDRVFSDPDSKDLLKVLASAAAELKKNFGAVDIPWGKINFMKHGGREYLIGGGSSYHMLVEMSPTPKALSCFPLSACEDPESPQYTDITEIYAKKEYKPVWFTWEELIRHIESDTILDVSGQK